MTSLTFRRSHSALCQSGKDLWEGVGESDEAGNALKGDDAGATGGELAVADEVLVGVRQADPEAGEREGGEDWQASDEGGSGWDVEAVDGWQVAQRGKPHPAQGR